MKIFDYLLQCHVRLQREGSVRLWAIHYFAVAEGSVRLQPGRGERERGYASAGEDKKERGYERPTGKKSHSSPLERERSSFLTQVPTSAAAVNGFPSQ